MAWGASGGDPSGTLGGLLGGDVSGTDNPRRGFVPDQPWTNPYQAVENLYHAGKGVYKFADDIAKKFSTPLGGSGIRISVLDNPKTSLIKLGVEAPKNAIMREINRMAGKEVFNVHDWWADLVEDKWTGKTDTGPPPTQPASTLFNEKWLGPSGLQDIGFLQNPGERFSGKDQMNNQLRALGLLEPSKDTFTGYGDFSPFLGMLGGEIEAVGKEVGTGTGPGKRGRHYWMPDMSPFVDNMRVMTQDPTNQRFFGTGPLSDVEAANQNALWFGEDFNTGSHMQTKIGDKPGEDLSHLAWGGQAARDQGVNVTPIGGSIHGNPVADMSAISEVGGNIGNQDWSSIADSITAQTKTPVKWNKPTSSIKDVDIVAKYTARRAQQAATQAKAMADKAETERQVQEAARATATAANVQRSIQAAAARVGAGPEGQTSHESVAAPKAPSAKAIRNAARAIQQENKAIASAAAKRNVTPAVLRKTHEYVSPDPGMGRTKRVQKKAPARKRLSARDREIEAAGGTAGSPGGRN